MTKSKSRGPDDAENRPAERALHENDARFRSLANAAPVPMWTGGPNSTRTWFNDAWLAFVRRALEREVGIGWIEHVHTDDAARVTKAYAEAVERRAPFEIEYRLRRHDGQYRTVLESARPSTGDRAQVCEYVGTTVDITDQKTAGAAQGYLGAILECADEAIISKDLNGIIQWSNAAAERLFGYTSAELVGRPVRILIPADRQAEEDDILRRIKRGERVDHFETVRVRKDGRLIDISLTISPVRDGSGRIIGVSKIARDITAQKRAAAELEAQQAWFRITLASIGDAVIATDISGRVVFMNPVAERLTGWNTALAEGHDCRDVFHVLDEHRRRPAGDAVSRVLADGKVVAFGAPIVLVSTDGTERPIDESAAPIRDSEGRIIGVVLVFRDISERRRVELERQTAAAERERLLDAERAARAEAERASRVKDEFVAMVSHELRTPLNAILGWTQLMTRGHADAATMERGLDIVAKNTRLQAQLISDLLDISRIVSGNLELELHTIDLHQLVADAVATVRPEAESRRITINEHLDSRVRDVTGDHARLQQVLWNLLANAVKFTPDGGRIDVALRGMPGHAEITVADNGTGIRADVLPHVFERFHQADRAITRRFGGLGLGLSIVKHLVELHGGTAQAASAGVGLGATFTITLPLTTAARGAESTPPGALPTHERVSLASMRVLLVEDEPDTREFLRQLLEGCGASVRATASAQEALTAFRSDPPDILISDIGLPDVDGYDLMQRIRQDRTLRGNKAPAIALTAYARAEDRTRALGAGYQAHLAKPVESRALLASIASIADLAVGDEAPRS